MWRLLRMFGLAKAEGRAKQALKMAGRQAEAWGHGYVTLARPCVDRPACGFHPRGHRTWDLLGASKLDQRERSSLRLRSFLTLLTGYSSCVCSAMHTSRDLKVLAGVRSLFRLWPEGWGLRANRALMIVPENRVAMAPPIRRSRRIPRSSVASCAQNKFLSSATSDRSSPYSSSLKTFSHRHIVIFTIFVLN